VQSSGRVFPRPGLTEAQTPHAALRGVFYAVRVTGRRSTVAALPASPPDSFRLRASRSMWRKVAGQIDLMFDQVANAIFQFHSFVLETFSTVSVTGNAQNEQILSGLPPIPDIGGHAGTSHLCQQPRSVDQ